jgi:two-component system alkaline phosphatase synthesis response regulator PhoP
VSQAHRPTVLVAEDDPSVRMTLEFVLEDEGFSVLVAEDGEEALRLSVEHRPDAILLDQMMPKMDGKLVHAALRADAATSSIPVFVLSGMARGSEDDWAGAQFIGKPFNPEHLVDRIRSTLSKS